MNNSLNALHYSNQEQNRTSWYQLPIGSSRLNEERNSLGYPESPNGDIFMKDFDWNVKELISIILNFVDADELEELNIDEFFKNETAFA